MTEPKNPGPGQFGPNEIVAPIVVWADADYERAVELSEDEMPETFAGWQENLRMVESALPAGAVVVRLESDPDEVAEWCRSNGRKITAENRAAYALDRFRRENGV